MLMEKRGIGIERIELPPITGGKTGPRLVGGAAHIVSRSRGWLKRRISIHGRLIMVYPGRVWISGRIRAHHLQPGGVVNIGCTPEFTAHPSRNNRGASGKRPTNILTWPECTAQGGVVSVLLNRRETIVEIEVYPGQDGWMRLLCLYGRLRA